MGVTTESATIEPDATLWNQAGLTPSGDASGYIEKATGTGTLQRRIYSDIQGEASNHPTTLGFRVVKGVTDWIRVSNGGAGAEVWFNLVTGAQVGAANCSATIQADGSAWDIVVSSNTWDSAADDWSIWAADSAGVSTSTATVGDTMFTVSALAGSQVRARSWSSQSPAVGPVASNPNPDAQPYYGDGSGGLVFDGVDDYLQFAAGLTSSTSFTFLAVAELASGSGGNRYLLDNGVGGLGRLAFGVTSAGKLAWYEGGGGFLGNSVAMPLGSRQLVGLVMDAGSGIIRLGGAAVDSGSGNAHTFDDAPVLGDHYAGGGAASWDGAILGGALWLRVLTSTELGRAERWLATRHGVAL
jgi:hypothetical protein